MNNPEITLRKTPGNWSPDTCQRMPIAQAIDKMYRLGYKTVKIKEIDGYSYATYRNPKRKTYYTLIADLRDF